MGGVSFGTTTASKLRLGDGGGGESYQINKKEGKNYVAGQT